jgi:hypothetical protein
VNKVKDNNSLLFFALKPNSPGSTSWDTLKKEWMKIFKEWKRRNDAGANTSGAAEMYTELDQICQQIESLRVDAEQQAKAGARRSSFQAPRQEEINSMINGDLRGRARLVARDLGEQSACDPVSAKLIGVRPGTSQCRGDEIRVIEGTQVTDDHRPRHHLYHPRQRC